MVFTVYDFVEDITNEVSTIGEKLIPNLYSFLIQLLALIVMILVVIFFAYKPIRKNLDKRSQFIEDTINSTKENNAISERNILQSEETVLASKKQAKEIIENAEQLAKEKQNNMILSTEKEIERMKKEADLDIAKSKEEALEDIHKEMVSIALEASKEVLKREVSEKDNSRLVEEFIKENLND